MDGSGASTAATFSERLAAYIEGERFANIDAAAVAKTKHIIAYHVGLGFRGLAAKDPDALRALAFAREMSEGGGASTLIGQSDKATLADAVFANCQIFRCFGLDDVIFRTGIHPGLVTLPIAFALTEKHHRSGQELIAAIVVGYEMLGKFAQWSWSLESPRRATMPFGPFGSVATAARLLRLDREQTAVCIGYAAHTAMGLAESDLGPISHFYGMVCRNGLTGAMLARAGAWASPTVLEGRFGFLEAFLGSAQVDQDQLLAELGHDYAVMESCEKRYRGTGLNQVPIEQMRELVRDHRLGPDDIAHIHVDFPIERKNFGGGHGKGPFLPGTAASSVAFQFALLLLDGDLRLERYEELDNPEILKIVDRCDFDFVHGKSVRYARLRVETADGRVFEREGDEFFFEPEDHRTMVERGAVGLLPQPQIDRFLDLLEHLEDVDDASELVRCLAT